MKIKSILLSLHSQAAQREVKVELSSGQLVTIVGTYGAFEQYGEQCSTPQFAATLPVAERYTKWLNGGKLPKPDRYEPITTSQPA
jgi:hypothetical protein